MSANETPPSSSKAIVILLSIWMTVVTVSLIKGIIEIWPKVAATMRVVNEQSTLALSTNPPVPEAVPSATDSATSGSAKGAAPGTTVQPAGTAATPNASASGSKPLVAANAPDKQGDQSDQVGSLVLLILMLGAAGAQIHVLQSFIDYVGNGTFKNRWALWYVERPLIGALVAFVAYAGMRGGVMGLDVAFGKAGGNLWGLVSISLVSGMFSENLTLKLREVFATLLSIKQPEFRSNRKDTIDGNRTAALTLTKLEPSTVSLAAPVPVKITGTDFNAHCKARIDGEEKNVNFKSAIELEFPATSLPTAAGAFEITIFDSLTTKESASLTLTITV